ncbi:MAG: molybdopterin converting factor subunit 1 [Acidobacteriaceae bacterium]
MRVRVLLFGVLTERLGGKERVVELAEQATVADVVAWARGLRLEEGLVRSLAVAVNREYAQTETRLSDGDEVALLPPVSGGCRGRAV